MGEPACRAGSPSGSSPRAHSTFPILTRTMALPYWSMLSPSSSQPIYAEVSELSLPTIQRMEASDGVIRGNVESLTKLIGALEQAGIELIGESAASLGEGRGVRLRRRADTGSAVGTLYGERLHGVAAPAEPPAPARATRGPDLPAAPFGADVETRFPASAYDIDEAAACLALRRPTAAVFHSLCVLRQGLRAHARWQGVADPPAQAGRRWQAIVGDLRDAGDDSELLASLDAVRRGWRGAALQLGPKYTEEEAERIFRLVEAFMRRLAELCDEDGAPAALPTGKPG